MAESKVSLLFGSKKGATIGELVCDATLKETHDYKNEVTQWPIEEGANISDHIRQAPDEVEINGFVTNSPVLQANVQRLGQFVGSQTDPFIAGAVGTAANVGGLVYKNLKRPGSVNQVELARDILLDISGRTENGSNHQPLKVKIVTGLRSYSDMAMLSLNMQRDARTGEAMPFTARFRKIRTVSTDTVTIPRPSTDVSNTTGSTESNKVNTNETTVQEGELASGLYNGLVK